MRRGLIMLICMLFVFSASLSVMATDTPYIPDDNTSDGCGPYTDPDTSDNSSPDSTDSGDSWDNSGSNSSDYGDGYSSGGVYY
ncbi:MAG TPA: hypothetical protein PLM07_18160 [Candidatus Rifleibacterium sp.]|nr:hypothetical protein [Candidatus Rifleibacterium sp.]HPT47807.1 hypothetical protein [Candidatus Rifleibacterium sp.]